MSDSDISDTEGSVVKTDGYCRFNDNNDASVTLGHGAVVWEASAVFAKFMENNPSNYPIAALRGKTILELGSGCGLGGLSFMLRGALVTFTDLEMVIQELTGPNVNRIYKQISSLAIGNRILEPIVFPIDWTDPDPFHDKSRPPFDIILLTDCVFSMELLPHLLRTMRMCSGPNTRVIICHEIRDEDINSAFVSGLKADFQVKRIPSGKLHPDFRSSLIELLVAKPRRNFR